MREILFYHFINSACQISDLKRRLSKVCVFEIHHFKNYAQQSADLIKISQNITLLFEEKLYYEVIALNKFFRVQSNEKF